MGSMVDPAVIGISAVSYVLPGQPVALAALAAEGKLDSSVEVLQEFGFEGVHISDVPADELALQALQRLLADQRWTRKQSTRSTTPVRCPTAIASPRRTVLEDFSYPVARLQYRVRSDERDDRRDRSGGLHGPHGGRSISPPRT